VSVGLTYAVDLVLCIDATASMAEILDDVKRRALDFPNDLIAGMRRLSKQVTRLRLRVIAFRDIHHDDVPFQVSDFFDLPAQSTEFEQFLNTIAAQGGGDDPESSLEALAIAIHSDWVTQTDKQRHAIVVFTDAPAHRLEHSNGRIPAPFAAIVPSNIDELTEMWEGDHALPSQLRQSAKRIVLFAPEAYPWTEISLNWYESIHFPSSAGHGLRDHEYGEIMDMLTKSV
jgi:hypothetical protein